MRKRLVGWLVIVAWSGTSALLYNAWSLLYAFSVTQPIVVSWAASLLRRRVAKMAVMPLNALLARLHACHS
jgi:hypothetical protein